jgi:hypothetical protein
LATQTASNAQQFVQDGVLDHIIGHLISGSPYPLPIRCNDARTIARMASGLVTCFGCLAIQASRAAKSKG